MTRLFTWSIAGAGHPAGTNTAGSPMGPSLDLAARLPQFENRAKLAINTWRNALDVDFMKIPDNNAADAANVNTPYHVRFMLNLFSDTPQNNNTVATTIGWLGALSVETVVHFNDLFTNSIPSPNIFGDPNLQYVITHELGHHFGLGHDFDDPYSIMNYTGVLAPDANDLSKPRAQPFWGAGTDRAQKLAGPIGKILSLYRGAYLGTPDNEGLKYWNNRIVDGAATFTDVINAMSDLWAVLSANDLVSLFYNRTLGRSPTADELTFWVSWIGSNGKVPFIQFICESQEAYGVRYNIYYASLWYE